jgi:hypothetical protein
MNEYKLLKQICDTIWYEIENEYCFYSDFMETINSKFWEKDTINIREIIYTTEFMDKLAEHTKWRFSKHTMIEIIMLWLWESLDNPVKYIDSLIEE